MGWGWRWGDIGDGDGDGDGDGHGHGGGDGDGVRMEMEMVIVRQYHENGHRYAGAKRYDPIGSVVVVCQDPYDKVNDERDKFVRGIRDKIQHWWSYGTRT